MTIGLVKGSCSKKMEFEMNFRKISMIEEEERREQIPRKIKKILSENGRYGSPHLATGWRGEKERKGDAPVLAFNLRRTLRAPLQGIFPSKPPFKEVSNHLSKTIWETEISVINIAWPPKSVQNFKKNESFLIGVLLKCNSVASHFSYSSYFKSLRKWFIPQ